MKSRQLLLVAAAAALAASACRSAAGPELATLQFRITSDVGPCSENVRVRFTLDGLLLGEQDFQIRQSPLRNESPQFSVPPGTHTIRAQLTRWGGATLVNNPLWPDTTVTLVTGQLFVHTNDLYCS